jgi:hypothetical protein
LATLTKPELGKNIESLARHQDELSRALDLLLTGF